ncbi:hypothetical protein, partial [Pseudomonas syringae group genomosp. 7]|uniref:hypothetical protein n=1 Tax=Pseudomonas syringae group genomosp. 7 TaxID=251699 RepID=UPI00376FFE83
LTFYQTFIVLTDIKDDRSVQITYANGRRGGRISGISCVGTDAFAYKFAAKGMSVLHSLRDH